jgi:hypothetical protein
MEEHVPDSVKVVDTPTLIDLERESKMFGLNENLPPKWVAEHAEPFAWHYLTVAFINRAAAGKPAEPHYRCHLWLTVREHEGWAGPRDLESLLDIGIERFRSLADLTEEGARRMCRRFLGAFPRPSVLEFMRETLSLPPSLRDPTPERTSSWNRNAFGWDTSPAFFSDDVR